jgi:hypothetical protein
VYIPSKTDRVFCFHPVLSFIHEERGGKRDEKMGKRDKKMKKRGEKDKKGVEKEIKRGSDYTSSREKRKE